MFDDNENIQQLKSGRDGDEEIARQNRPRVILQERRPALITTGLTWWSLRHVLAYCPRRDPDPQFNQQLIGDTLFAPHWVFVGHSTNQRPQFGWNRRSTQFATESPKQSPPRSVPVAGQQAAKRVAKLRNSFHCAALHAFFSTDAQ